MEPKLQRRGESTGTDAASSGIRRKVDDLGRVVIPAAIRRSLNMTEGDAVEVSVEGERVVLEKPREACVFCGRESETLHHFRARLVCRGCLAALGGVDQQLRVSDPTDQILHPLARLDEIATASIARPMTAHVATVPEPTPTPPPTPDPLPPPGPDPLPPDPIPPPAPDPIPEPVPEPPPPAPDPAPSPPDPSPDPQPMPARTHPSPDASPPEPG